MTPRWTARILAILAAACLPAIACAIDVSLKYDKCPSSSGRGYHPHYRKILEKSVDRPPGDWKLPELKSKIPVYSLAPLAGKERLFVLDRKDREGAFYDILYFDANGNRDLTDDPPIEAPNTADSELPRNSVGFPTVDLTFSVGGKQVPYAFRAGASFRQREGGDLTREAILSRDFTFYLSSYSWLYGEFELEGQAFKVLLGDGNVNGLYGEVPSGKQGEPSGDRLFITSADTIASGDSNIFGDLLSLKDRTYKLRVDNEKMEMSVEPAGGELYTVDLAMEVDKLSIFGEDGSHGIVVCQTGKQIRVPPGRYRLGSYSATRKDAEGDVWTTSASGTELSPSIPIGPGGVKVFPFGEPYVSRATVISDPTPAEGVARPASLDFRIEGAAYEQVQDLRRVSGDKTTIPLSQSRNYRPKEPTYKVMTATGETVAEGAFSYG
jgi:hypothetical protein